MLLAAFYFLHSFGIEITDAHGGAALVPRILAAVLVICSLLLIFFHVRKKQREKMEKIAQARQAEQEVEKRAEVPSNYKSVVLTMAAISVYALLLGFVGFIYATIVYLFFQVLLLSPKKNTRSVIVAGAVSVVFTFLIYLLFYRIFLVILPRGTLWYTF